MQFVQLGLFCFTQRKAMQRIYSNDPPVSLSQPTPTTIHIVPVTVTFAESSVTYAERTITIPAVKKPTWLYVTIADTAQQGENSSFTLHETCQDSCDLCGEPGHIYLGAILAMPEGNTDVTLAGGWPVTQTFQVVA
jgi:hypothetical protein